VIGSETIEDWYSITDVICSLRGWSERDVCNLIPYELIIYSSKEVERRKEQKEADEKALKKR